jgi:fluoride exporter
MTAQLSLHSFFAVGVGAAIGAWARWGLALWLNPHHAHFPLGTLAANLIGGLLVGVAIALLEKYPDISPLWRLWLVTGFLGALTTFSTFSVEVVALLERSAFGWALLVAGSHLFLSLLLTFIGLWLVRTVCN